MESKWRVPCLHKPTIRWESTKSKQKQQQKGLKVFDISLTLWQRLYDTVSKRLTLINWWW